MLTITAGRERLEEMREHVAGIPNGEGDLSPKAYPGVVRFSCDAEAWDQCGIKVPKHPEGFRHPDWHDERPKKARLFVEDEIGLGPLPRSAENVRSWIWGAGQLLALHSRVRIAARGRAAVTRFALEGSNRRIRLPGGAAGAAFSCTRSTRGPNRPELTRAVGDRFEQDSRAVDRGPHVQRSHVVVREAVRIEHLTVLIPAIDVRVAVEVLDRAASEHLVAPHVR